MPPFQMLHNTKCRNVAYAEGRENSDARHLSCRLLDSVCGVNEWETRSDPRKVCRNAFARGSTRNQPMTGEEGIWDQYRATDTAGEYTRPHLVAVTLFEYHSRL